MKNIIIGTAGHIDHGKTTLIKYLTGIDTDRLPEEKEKKMTIDIGFSFFKTEDLNIGIVDVPGHEKFIKNMLSGTTGINYVLFVIACDDGIMPQTIEHLEILKLLKINIGIIVLTKTDLVKQEKIEALKKEIENKFGKDFFANFSFMETTTKDIKTFENLKEKIIDDVKKIEFLEKKENFLMYIDRSFSIKGFGTVVTGSISSGNIKLGENLFLYPKKIKVKIKSIENFGQKVTALSQNERGALNLNGIDFKNIKRGDFLYSKNDLVETDRIDVYFTILDKKLLKNNQKIRIYLGTSELLGKILLFKKIENGWLGQIIFENKVFVFNNQLGILRNYSPVITLGGIKILNIYGEKIKKNTPLYENYLENMIENFQSKNLKEQKNITLANDIKIFLENYHKENHLKKGISLFQFKKIFNNKKDLENILENLKLEKVIKIENGIVSLENFKIKLNKDEKIVKEKIFKIYKNTRFYVLKYEIIENMLSENKDMTKQIHNYMLENEMIISLGDRNYILSGYFKEVQKILIDYFSTKDTEINGISLGEFRNILGINRESSLLIILKLEKINFLINKKNIRFLRREK